MQKYLSDINETNLRLPGPVPVPKDILEEQSKPLINHRGEEYKNLLLSCTEKLQKIFCTKNELYIITTSGTGVMEASISNFLSQNDEIIVVSVGWFGDRFAEIATSYNIKVRKLNFDHGQNIDIDILDEFISSYPNAKALYVTHNETSTGVQNDLELISKTAKKYSLLFVVDGISSVASVPCNTDKLGIDVLISASQKGWVTPPGLAFISVSNKAWDYHYKSNCPKYYFDISKYKYYFKKGQPPFTPAIGVMYSLDKSLTLLLEETMPKVYKRHSETAKKIRSQLIEIGFEIFPVNENSASDTLTAVKVPTGISVSELINNLHKNHNVIISAGQGNLSDKIIRIGHLGLVSENEIEWLINSLLQTISVSK
jgi:aspartate aminotransferase-like enzyme|tara:strand:- start:182 stop:1291 length:1110 start_codon:yes stop_codon:yes gene_type:complete